MIIWYRIISKRKFLYIIFSFHDGIIRPKMPVIYFKAAFSFNEHSYWRANLAWKREVKYDSMLYFIVLTSKDPLGEIINQSHISASREKNFHAYFPRMIFSWYISSRAHSIICYIQCYREKLNAFFRILILKKYKIKNEDLRLFLESN